MLSISRYRFQNFLPLRSYPVDKVRNQWQLRAQSSEGILWRGELAVDDFSLRGDSFSEKIGELFVT